MQCHRDRRYFLVAPAADTPFVTLHPTLDQGGDHSGLLTFAAAKQLRLLRLDARARTFWDGTVPPAVEVCLAHSLIHVWWPSPP